MNKKTIIKNILMFGTAFLVMIIISYTDQVFFNMLAIGLLTLIYFDIPKVSK